MFDTTAATAVAAHADNDYAQLLAEMGLTGAILVGLFLAGISFAILRGYALCGADLFPTPFMVWRWDLLP